MNTPVNAKTNQNHKEHVLFVVLSICQPMSSTTGTCEVAILDFFYEKVFLSLFFISVYIFSTYRANTLVFLLII